VSDDLVLAVVRGGELMRHGLICAIALHTARLDEVLAVLDSCCWCAARDHKSVDAQPCRVGRRADIEDHAAGVPAVRS
jgi:hypothetical protein